MRTRTTLRLGSVAALALIAGACSDVAGPRSDGGVAPSNQDTRMLRGIDREFAQLARSIPGFGGLYSTADGTPVVYLKDLGQASRARQLLARSRLLGGVSPSLIQVRAAQNDYLQLTDWRGRLRSGLAGPGLIFTDIDESTNRIRVGVEAGTPHEDVAAQVAKLDIPAEAVVVEDAAPVQFVATTLRDKVRPTRGGLQIVWPDPISRLFICTIGFNARVPNDRALYFVTASHCSGEAGGVQNTPFFQPLPAPENLIAREVADPPYFTAGCYPNRRCRFSDASLERYEPGVDAFLGGLGHTTLRGLTAGSITIDDTRPFFYIDHRAPFSIVGQTLDKLGLATGWTVGTVAVSCLDVFVSQTDIALLCQDGVFSGVGPGDSGSPVFESSRSPLVNHVTLFGILWGSSSSSFGPIFFFSPLENIEFELGPLAVTVP